MHFDKWQSIRIRRWTEVENWKKVDHCTSYFTCRRCQCHEIGEFDSLSESRAFPLSIASYFNSLKNLLPYGIKLRLIQSFDHLKLKLNIILVFLVWFVLRSKLISDYIISFFRHFVVLATTESKENVIDIRSLASHATGICKVFATNHQSCEEGKKIEKKIKIDFGGWMIEMFMEIF